MKVRSHAVSTIVIPKVDSYKALVNIYDSSYAIEIFRNNFSFIGGNAKGDKSLRSVIERELSEELNLKSFKEQESLGEIIGSNTIEEKVSYLRNKELAPVELRNLFRNEIINGLESFSDYLVRVDKDYIEKTQDLISIFSVFISVIDQHLFDEVGAQINRRYNMLIEGDTKIVNYKDLSEGKIRGAWGYASIASDIFSIKVPEYNFIHAINLGVKPKESFTKYKSAGIIYEVNPGD